MTDPIDSSLGARSGDRIGRWARGTLIATGVLLVATVA